MKHYIERIDTSDCATTMTWHPVVVCHDCNMGYPFPLDAVLPDELWARISPAGDEGGLLCANCIVARLAKLDPSPVAVKITPLWAEDYE